MRFLVDGGALHLGLAIYGALIEVDSDANFIPINHADNWLPSRWRSGCWCRT